MIKRALLLGGVALLVGATSCSKDTNATTTPTTAAASTTTAAASASSTTAKDGETTTTKKSGSKTPVTKPTKIEKIDASKLPSAATKKPKNFDLTEDESDCINTVLFTYASDSSNATDDATMSGVLGGAIAVCVDQDKLADGIVTGIKQSAPSLTDTQAACLKKEIAGTDNDALAVFLGTFLYEGEGANELQQPFIEALGKACNLG